MPLALGFDYGLSRIGVASGQTLTRTASPIGAIRAQDGIPKWDEIESLLNQWQPDLVVVGLPLHADGSVSDMAVRAKQFGQRIHGRFGVDVHYIDEFETTREARALTAFHRKASDQQGALDAACASLILERWLGEYND